MSSACLRILVQMTLWHRYGRKPTWFLETMCRIVSLQHNEVFIRYYYNYYY